MADMKNVDMSKVDMKDYGYKRKQSIEEQELCGEIILQFQNLFGLRGDWNSHWTEIAQRILPMDSYIFQNLSQLAQQGDKRNQMLFDSTGLLALQRFGAILDSLLTPAGQFWHKLKATDATLMRDKATRLYFEDVTKILFHYRYGAKSNFAAQNQGQYMSLGAYGTGAQFIDRLYGDNGLPTKGIRYKNVHLSECYLLQNHQGIIDTVYRYFIMEARQVVQKFGEKCPPSIRDTADRNPSRQYFFLHCVKPRREYDPERRDFKGMPYASYYVSMETRDIVEEGGYRSFPYAVSRYYQAANETYGRSPAMDALPALKTLNEQKKTMLKQGHRVTDPVLLAHDDGIIDGFSLEPGAINAGGISKDGRMLVQPLPTGSIQAGQELMNDERQLINDTFLVSLFQILLESKEMTATEVMERTREKGILLAPTIGRQNSEYLSPMIHRELDILASQNLLPKMPPLLASAKGDYKVEFDSPMTRAMKAEWASGAARSIQQFAEMAQLTQDPSYLDYFDMNKAAPELAMIFGTPDSWIRSPEDVAKIRQSRAAAQQQQQAIEAAPAAASVIKTMQSARK